MGNQAAVNVNIGLKSDWVGKGEIAVTFYSWFCSV